MRLELGTFAGYSICSVFKFVAVLAHRRMWLAADGSTSETLLLSMWQACAR